jgi:hypothetical protein
MPFLKERMKKFLEECGYNQDFTKTFINAFVSYILFNFFRNKKKNRKKKKKNLNFQIVMKIPFKNLKKI